MVCLGVDRRTLSFSRPDGLHLVMVSKVKQADQNVRLSAASFLPLLLIPLSGYWNSLHPMETARCSLFRHVFVS